MPSITSWRWTIDGVVVATTQAITVSGLAAGWHTVALAVEDDAGETAIRSWSFEVKQAPRQVTSYEWTIGEVSKTGQVVTQNFENGGFYSVGLRMRDSAGAESYREIPYLVKVSGEYVFFEWDFGDGSTATGEVVEHQYTYGGNFVVTMRATDFWGRQVSVSATVTVEVWGVASSAQPLSGRVPLTVAFSPKTFLAGVNS